MFPVKFRSYLSRHPTEKKSKDSIRCNFCKKSLKATGRSATTFICRIKRKHTIDVQKDKVSATPVANKKSNLTQANTSSQPLFPNKASNSKENGPEANGSMESGRKREDILSFLILDLSKQVALKKLCSKTVFKDNLQLSVLDKPGMKQLISKITGGLKAPSRRTIHRHMNVAARKQELS
jgi:hypothetical protein